MIPEFILIFIMSAMQCALTQISISISAPAIVKPSENTQLICHVTGVLITDGSKLHAINFVRQFSGDRFEFLAHLNYGEGTAYNQLLQSRLSLSRNTAKNEVYLVLKHLAVDDSAIYHCVGQSSRVQFDLWSKGSYVEVTTEQITFPVVFPLIPVGQETNTAITFGCLAAKYFPNPISVAWGTTSGQSVSGTKNFQFPLSGNPSRYSFVSQATVSRSEWNSNNYSCEIKHFSSTIVKYIPKGCVSPPASPSVQILQGPCISTNDDEVELSCQAFNLTAQDATIKWFQDEKLTYIQQDIIYLGKNNYLYGIESRVRVQQGVWNNGARMKCQVTDSKTGKSSEASTRKCSDAFNCLGIEVIITPPTIEDLYIFNTCRIPCSAYNLKQTDGYSFRFSYPGNPGSLDTQKEDPLLNRNGTFTVTSILTVDREIWLSNTEITCIFSIPGLPQPIRRIISRKTGETLMLPNVAVYPPPSEDIEKDEICHLLCLAYGFHPETIYIGWQEEDTEVYKNQYINLGPKRSNRNQSFTATSILSVPCSKWKDGTKYACVVGHESIPLKLLLKPISVFSGNPTKVSVNVVMSDSTLSCYS